MAYRYIGNKTRLATRLLEIVAHAVPTNAIVGDVMCGTASFSAALRATGYRVMASDVMTYSYYHAIVRLLLDRPPQFARLDLGSYKDVLNHLNALEPVEGLMTREYSPAGSPAGGHAPRLYLTAENAGRLDAMLEKARAWNESGELDALEHALLRHDLVLAVNRVANIAGTYGHFRSTWAESALRPIGLRPNEFHKGRIDHDVRQGRAEELASRLSCDLCYIDPPYTKRQYAANYHLIETVARGDEPEAVGVSGLRPWRDQYSDFCSKVRIRGAFEDVLLRADCPHFLISYSEDGLLPRDEMLAFLAKHGDVTCFEFDSVRFRSNQSSLARVLKEYVFWVDRAGSGRITIRQLDPAGQPDQPTLFAA
jgi:adenine-specific DNA-methyltransferase